MSSLQQCGCWGELLSPQQNSAASKTEQSYSYVTHSSEQTDMRSALWKSSLTGTHSAAYKHKGWRQHNIIQMLIKIRQRCEDMQIFAGKPNVHVHTHRHTHKASLYTLLTSNTGCSQLQHAPVCVYLLLECATAACFSVYKVNACVECAFVMLLASQ